jgi:HlyD family secretion protein
VAQDKPDIEDILAQGKSRHGALRWSIAAILVAVVAFAGWYMLAETADDPGNAYVTMPVSRGGLTVSVTATGTVEPTNLVEISSELSGTVRTVNVDSNDTVSSGQVLAELDTEKLEAALQHSRATLDARLARVAEAEATVSETAANYERMKELAAGNVVSIQVLQSAEAAHARAEASVTIARADAKVAEADLRIQETNLEKACICSPINGVVLDRNVDAGQIVASSLQAPVLFTVAEDLSQMELRVDIDEADVGAVRVGNPASFSVEAYQGMVFPAEISEILFSPRTVEGVVTYEAILSIDNSELLLRPGMTATAEIIVEKIDDALLVPNAALRFAPPAEPEDAGERGGGLLGLLIPDPPAERATAPLPAADGSRTIWVLRDEKAEPVTVRTGSTDGLQSVLLDGGLVEGDLVVTDLAEQ